MGIEKVVHGGKVLAILLRANKKISGVEFYTDKEDTFQMGAQIRESGVTIQPHIHITSERTIHTTSEMVHLDSGKMEVTIYDDDKNSLTKKIMNTGDTILFLGGGHGFHFITKSKLIEVKQGPYQEVSSDKEKF